MVQIRNDVEKKIGYFIAKWVILAIASFCFLLFAELDLITLPSDFSVSIHTKIAVVAVSILLMPIGYFFLRSTEPIIRESPERFFERVQMNFLTGTSLYTAITALGFFFSLIDASGAHRPITIAGLGLTILTGGKIKPICANLKNLIEMAHGSGKRARFG